jgi:DNA polymerase V
MPQCKSEFTDGANAENKPGLAPTARRRIVPIHPVGQSDSTDACSGAESFALMVLGDSMAPEFVEGEIVVIEPDGLAVDGSYVLAFVGDEWIFRQLRGAAGCWALYPLNAAYPTLPLPEFSAVRGVIIQKSKPGRRRASKRYVA